MQDPAQEGPLAGKPARHQTASERSAPAGQGGPAGAPAPPEGMTRRQASAIRTREILIETGLRLADRTSLAGLSINLLVEEAGVAKGTFFHHFGDRSAYLLALHREFHSRIFAEIFHVIDGMEPGAARVLAASRTYLDACLRDRGVRALLLEARAERKIADEIRSRNKATAEYFKTDFQAMNVPHPYESALLWIGLVVEAALTELDAGGRQPALRAAIAGFLALAAPGAGQSHA
jgi:TetR/AcrR family transcriptional regulator, transcriptional repressor for nem operon